MMCGDKEMTSEKLMFIKRVQRLYTLKFNDRLIVDFPQMAGVIEKSEYKQRWSEMPSDMLNNLLQKHKVNLDNLKTEKTKPKNSKEKQNKIRFLVEFSNTVFQNKEFSFELCAKQINRERTMIYYYKDLETNKIIRRNYKRRKSII